MDREHLLGILQGLSAKNVQCYERSKNVQLSCLLAPFTHRGRVDSSPSASISFGESPDTSLVHCFSSACGFGGTFVQYLTTCNDYMGGEISAAVDEARYLERDDPSARLGAVLKKFERKYSTSAEATEKLEVWSEAELSVFQKTLSRSFLEKRGISPEVAKTYGFMWEERTNRVVVPIRRYDGKLVGCVGRCWCPNCHKGEKHDGRFHNYWAFPSGKFLFNEHRVDRTAPIVVVEGIFDALRLASCGFPNALALFGSSISDAQAKKLTSFSQPIYLMLDGDAAGRSGTMKAIGILRDTAERVQECFVPEGKDPGDLSEEELEEILKTSRKAL